MERYDMRVTGGGGFPIESTMNPFADGDYVAVKDLQAEVKRLYDLVWGIDIPHPQTPEGREHHDGCQRIMKHIKEHLMIEED